MKIGLEKELWLLGTNGQPLIVPANIPHDDCGLLVEARGKPFDNVTDAVYSLMADETRIRQNVSKRSAQVGDTIFGATLDDSPIRKIDRKTEVDAQRQYIKNPITWQNIYGIRTPSNRRGTMTAAIHVSFTHPYEYETENHRKGTINRLFDFVNLFRALDMVFAGEIKMAGRKPGFYEIKDDGRVEYRSLPANVPYDVLVGKLATILSKPWGQWDKI